MPLFYIIFVVFYLCLLKVTFVFNNFINNEDSVLDPIVILPDLGKLRGSITKTAWTKADVYQFLGVPYAESPSNHLRFKSPVARKPWTNIKLANQHGTQCPNRHYLSTLTSEKLENDDLEDCLNLAIYTKNLEGNYSVIVYIHGGGFYNGSAADHPPNFFLEEDIVLVVPEYRLGALGFLSTQSNEIPGNVAVLDLILAFKWIKKYIKYFGGNSNEITAFGQSAGAALVNALMYSPAVPYGLFHRTILQSGTFLAKWAYNSEPLKLSQYVCLKLNCICDEIEQVNKCLMEASVKDLVKHESNYGMTIGDKNNILPVIPLELMKLSLKNYPMIVGVTKHDGSFILASLYDKIKTNGLDYLLHNPHKFIDVLIEKCREKDESGSIGSVIKKLLFTHDQLQGNFIDLIPGLIDLASILIFKGPALKLIQQNYPRYKENSIFLYTFDYDGEHTRFGYDKDYGQYPFNGGIHHSNDNLYLFPKYDLNESDTIMAKKMIQLWTSFAITGKPTITNNDFKWEPIKNDTGPYLHIDTKLSLNNDFLDEYLVTVSDPENIIRKNNLTLN